MIYFSGNIQRMFLGSSRGIPRVFPGFSRIFLGYIPGTDSDNGKRHMKGKNKNMKITVLTVGKIKEKYFTAAITEYAKRLSRYCKLEIVEVPDEKTPDKAPEAINQQIKEKEGEKLLAHIKDDEYVIALVIQGKELSSEQLAEKIAGLTLNGKSHLIFIIGGSLGLSDAVIKRADYHLSFSPMTFPHQLMRVVLLEQIYRAFKINTGEPYHK